MTASLAFRLHLAPACLALLVGLVACEREAPPPPPVRAAAPGPSGSTARDDPERLDAFAKQARQLTEEFQAALKKELLGAMAEGGPAAAIAVCNVEAPRIAGQISMAGKPPGVVVSRTALRVRNPENAPTPWQRAVLEDLARKLGQQAKPSDAPPEWAEISGETMRYMRAIPMGGLCVTCHGDAASLAAPVRAALAEKYPEDRATGFSPGELRGAFVVTAPR